MDETTKNQQGDATSEGEGGITSEEETPTFTQKQVEELIRKARSDERADVGRLRKAVEEANKIAESALKRLQEREEEDLKREEEAARDDPEKLTAVQLKREAIRLKAEAEAERRRVEAERTEILTQAEEVRHHRAERLSEKYNVDPSVLLKYGGTTKESMEDLAKSFGERSASSGETTATQTTRMTEPPDSGKTKGSGTGRKPTLEEVQAATPAEFQQKIESGEWVI